MAKIKPGQVEYLAVEQEADRDQIRLIEKRTAAAIAAIDPRLTPEAQREERGKLHAQAAESAAPILKAMAQRKQEAQAARLAADPAAQRFAAALANPERVDALRGRLARATDAELIEATTQAVSSADPLLGDALSAELRRRAQESEPRASQAWEAQLARLELVNAADRIGILEAVARVDEAEGDAALRVARGGAGASAIDMITAGLQGSDARSEANRLRAATTDTAA